MRRTSLTRARSSNFRLVHVGRGWSSGVSATYPRLCSRRCNVSSARRHPARHIDKQLEQTLISGVNLGARVPHIERTMRVRRSMKRETVHDASAAYVA